MNTNRVKVLFFIDSFHIGGMHKQILYLVKHLNKNVFQPIMVTQIPNGGLRSEFEKEDCKLYDLKWKKKFDISTVYRLIKILETEKPDIIFITQPQTFFYFRLARLFWYRKIVQIGSFRAMTFWMGHLKKRYQPLDNFFSRWLYSSSDYITVNSNVTRNYYSKIINVNSDKPITTIYNGSDFNFVISRQSEIIRQEMNISIDNIVIIMVARLDPWKDFITLFEAAQIVIKKVKKARFILVGDGISKYYLEQMIDKMDLKDNVFLIGEKKDIYNYINAADISVLSTNGEGFSNAILESMALCKPVIATNVGGNAELLGVKGESGLLVPPKSPEIFANAILTLIKDEKLRSGIGISARDRILNICDVNKYVSSYEKIFLSSIGIL